VGVEVDPDAKGLDGGDDPAPRRAPDLNLEIMAVPRYEVLGTIGVRGFFDRGPGR